VKRKSSLAGVSVGDTPIDALLKLAAASVLFVSSVASASDAELSPYEAETVEAALADTAAKVDPAPEGKTIEAIILRPLDVLEERDPLPQFAIDFLNFFHATTRPSLISQLLLVKTGQAYRAEFVEESARRLRSIRQLSLVLMVPLVGSAPDRVKLLVITKDIWSLRLNSDFRVSSGGLEYLLLQPAEENLGGLHHSASLRFELDPATYRFGFGYKIPRVGGSEIVGQLSSNFIVNRDSGEFEGLVGGLYYGQPLFSTRAGWSWVGSMTVRSETTRFFQGLEPLTFDAPATVEDDRIPIQYKTEALAGRVSFVRSFSPSTPGVALRDDWSAVNHDVLFGLEATRNSFRADHLSGLPREVQREFIAAEVPSSEQRLYPYLGYATYSRRFRNELNLDTLGLQENFRLGHDAYVKSYPVLDVFGSDRSFFGTTAGLSFTAVAGALVRVYGQATVETSLNEVYDANAAYGVRVVTPATPVGRLHFDAVDFRRFENDLNRRSSVGGDGRLRGYPSGAYRGENLTAYNLEFRSVPAQLWTVQLGAAAFFDTAAVWNNGESPDFRQDIGAGLRLVFPQLERTGMRVDWAVPLQLDPDVGVTSAFPGRFVWTFGQAFSFPDISFPNVAL
jgi:hypothetical protein